MIKHIIAIAALLLSGLAASAAAVTYEQEVADISRDFQSVIGESADPATRDKMFASILARATDLKGRYPNRGLPLAWIGWVKFSSMYSQTDPAAMMPLLLDSKTNLEKAVEIEPNCCGESAYVSLALIYQVPLTGKDQSETVKQYFAKAFAVDPNNAVTNTRYAGYLMRSGDYENALKHANAALAAPPLANRPTEDRAVREQAQQFIEQIKERQKK
jgi:tetratricopeptide (TPR) repeat protein